MTYSFRDYFPQSPDSQLRSPPPKDEPPKFPEGFRIFPSPDPNNPFGDPPKIQSPQKPLRIWDDPPIPAPYIPPMWPAPLLPSPATPDVFPDLSIIRLPRLPLPPQAPPYDLDPSNFPGQGEKEPGGLLGRLLALHAELARNAVDPYGSYSPRETRGPRTMPAPPQEFQTTPQKPVRILSRQPTR
jgi:hypothetical protein